MTEKKICQNCKKDFTVEPEDFQFYKKMDVPPPTWCFNCRIIRRMSFRNERTLYKRKCDAPGHSEELISIFSPDNKQVVFDHKEWWGDNWNPLDYGAEIDWNRPLLEQIGELWQKVPDVALLNINPVNSEYCSITEGNKNCYLVFGGDFNENTYYSTYSFHSKECMDTYWLDKGEQCYEVVDCISCSRLKYSRYCDSCYDSSFLFNCRNCHDCFGCANLNNKSYQIWNVQYTKEEYLEKIKQYDLSSRSGVENVRKNFKEHIIKYPRRFAYVLHSTNSTGDNLEQVKDSKKCFDIFGGAEDCGYVWLAYSRIKDLYDCDRVGLNAEKGVDSSTIYPGSSVFYSRFSFSAHDIYYSYNSHNSAYLFGCVGVRNKQHCILNKQYAKEEYEALLPRLIKHMSDVPYRDKAGRVYKYGEFFPPEISPFAYNETVAQELAPMSKETAGELGYVWRDNVDKGHKMTLPTGGIPDPISKVENSITQETIECAHKGNCVEQCTKAFRIIPAELEYYRNMKIPLPNLCPSCRHFQRLAQRNPLSLWTRRCRCAGVKSENGSYRNTSSHSHGESACAVEFETSYAPDRQEIVYCEACYQSEVA